MKTEDSPPSLWHRSTTRRLLLWFVTGRTLRRLLFTAIALVTLVALFYAVENWRGHRLWKQHLATVDPSGNRFILTSLVPPAIPESDNLAFAPVFRPLFDFGYNDQGVFRFNDPEGKERLENALTPLSKGPYGPHPMSPTNAVVGDLLQGTLTDFDACVEACLANGVEPDTLSGTNAAERLLSFFTPMNPLLDEVAQAAAQRTQCRFPVDYANPLPPSILLPHLAPLKGLIRAYAFRAIVRLEMGETDTALADLLLGLRLCEALQDEPLLISQLVCQTGLRLQLQVLREGLSRHAWNRDQLARIDRRLATLDLLAGCRLAFEGERAAGVQTIEYARQQGWSFNPELIADAFGNDWAPRFIQLMPDGWFYRNMLNFSRWQEAGALAAVDVRQHRIDPTTAERGKRDIDHLPRRPTTVFVHLLATPVTKAMALTARTQTYLDAGRVACALEIYRIQHDTLPDSLSMLVPDPLKHIPNDVIDGKPLRLRLEPDGGYITYGVGWDERDENGTLAWNLDKPRRPELDLMRGDWTWIQPTAER